MKRITFLAKIIFTLIVVSGFITGCEKDDKTTTTSSSSAGTTDCQTDASKRRGARCKDGTESKATGSGACSHHGGVAYWLCK